MFKDSDPKFRSDLALDHGDSDLSPRARKIVTRRAHKSIRRNARKAIERALVEAD